MKDYISKSFRQVTAFLLCAVMFLSAVPVQAFATELPESDSETAVVSTEAPETEVTEAADSDTADETEGNTEETEAAADETEAATKETEAATEETEAADGEIIGDLTVVPDADVTLETEDEETADIQASTETQETIGETEYETDAAAAVADIVLASGLSIPGYATSGAVSKSMEYDCGNGVANDGSKSYLTIVTATNAQEFAAYKQLLTDRGYRNTMEKEIASDDSSSPNLFASYVDAAGQYKLHTYYFPFYEEVRIIVDTQKDTVAGFSYAAQSGETVAPIVSIYGLSMATNGYDTQLIITGYGQGRRNCGALVVLRMPDNSLFIHDGGDVQQWSDDACDEFLAFCRELTGTTGTNEKMVINTWFLSHAHSDHYMGFPRFINKYHDHFDMKNIMYNIDVERTNTTLDIHEYMQLVESFYPNVKYYKPHTGETFTIAGVQFDVMYTLEDRYVPTENGDLITDTNDLGGTYRGYFYREKDVMTSKSVFNDTCTVLRVTFENGVSSILYADMNKAEQTLFDIYPESALKANIVMIPHHGYDSHPELLAKSDATIFLFPQHKQAIYGPDGDYTTNDGEGVINEKLFNNFLFLRGALDAAGREEGKDYKFYWGGMETAAIDINSMSGIATLAATDEGMSGMTLDTSAPKGITVYTAEANDDVYTNAWTVYDLNDGTAMVSTFDGNLIGADNDSYKSEKEVTTETSHIRFTPYKDVPLRGGQYLIRSVAYPKYIMSYAAVAKVPGTVNKASSLVRDDATPPTSAGTNFFYESTDNIYMDHSNRDNVIWIIEQYNDELVKYQGDGKTKLSKYTGNKDANGNILGWIGGTAGESYRRISLQKGTSSDDAYWYSIEGNDGSTSQYRFLDQRYVDSQKWIRNALYPNDDYDPKYYLEKLSDGTYLVYFRNNSADYRILTCDANGNWKTVRYDDNEPGCAPVSQIETDLPNLKVKLYTYEYLNQMKTVRFDGPTVFNVERGTTYEQVLSYIQQNIEVRYDNRHDLPIPGSGDTPKVGYYWLDMTEKTFDSSKAGTYTFTVKYRNDNGKDTAFVTTLTVNVADITLSGKTHYVVMEGVSQSDVDALIQEGITVTKTAGSDVYPVLYSATPTAGKYWLQYNYTFNSNPSGIHTYTVTVNYRNPNGTDTAVDTKLMVIVRAPKLKLTGTTTYYVDEGVTEAAVRTNILQNITVTETVENKTISYAATPTVGSYWLQFDSTFSSSAAGDHDYFVKVNYRNADGTDTLIETLAVYVEQKITEWTAPNHMVGTVPLNAGLTTIVQYVEGETSSDITFTVNGEERFVTVGLLTKDGKPVDTSIVGTYEGLTLTYMDQVICDKTFTLIVTESNDALNYPQKGQDGYVGVDKQSTTTTDEFKETGVADIQLSATGTPPEKGIDLIVVMDLSGSMKNALDSEATPPTYQQSRVYAMEQSLKEMVKSMQTSGADIRIAMSDFGDLDHYVLDGNQVDDSIDGKSVFDANHSNGTYVNKDSADDLEYEYYNHLNFVFTDDDPKPAPYGIVHTKYNKSNPSYTGVVVPTVYTGSREVDADAFVDVNSLYDGTDFTDAMKGIVAKIDENATKSIGTNYDIGLEYAYYLGYAIQQDNINKGENRDIVCIFMSDGAPMQYNYFSGNPQSTAWAKWISGEIDSIASTGYSETNLPEGLQKLEDAMLAKLKAGKLVRPEYHRDGGVAYEGTYYFKYYPNRENATDPHFYTIMNSMNFDLDWEYLCRIAEVNGIAGFNYDMFLQDTQMNQLRDLLLDRADTEFYEDKENSNNSYYISKLINPGYYEERYFTACTSYEGDDFFEAMESIGIDCSWDLFTKIAYRNCLDEMKDLVGVLMNTPGEGDYATHSPYGYFYNAEGKNWWAEAIKGDPTKLYPVINKYAYENSTDQPYTYYGDVREDYNDDKYISGYRGLGIDMYTVSFSVADNGYIKADIAETVLKRISSGDSYFFSASTQSGLTDSLNAIVGSMSTAATRAWFEDTMGDNYDLYIGQPETTYADGEEISTIHVYEYQRNEAGNRVGDPIIRETITIKDLDGDGDVDATSDMMYNTVTDSSGNITREYYDIWNEDTNVITGKFVRYNANTAGTNTNVNNNGVTGLDDGDVVDGKIKIDLTGDSVLDYALEPETFFWTIGVIGETEMVLEYPVYLTGSKEGNLKIPAGEVGVYDTNKKADLHYVNYLGHNCEQTTVPPAFPWGNPAVGYVFYLVDENGNPLDSYGRITDFTHSLKMSNAVYENLNTGDNNNVTTITAREKLATTDLGKNYQLFDPTASYTVVYDTAWQNDGGTTTYVTHYGGADYSNAANSATADMNGGTLDLEKTVVYFALMVKQPGSGLKVDKTVEATKDANEFILTLDAYATGHEVTITKPADIVLVLDHSASMRTPVGAPAVMYTNDKVLYTGAGRMTKEELEPTMGQHTGYYVAQSTTTFSWFVMRYDAEEAHWYAYNVPSTQSIVNVEYKDKDDAKNKGGYTEHTQTQHWSYENLPAQLVYYKSQYAVLYDNIKTFVDELQASGAAHRVAIIGFAGSEEHRTNLYVGGDENMLKYYDAMYNSANETRRTELYQKALKDLQDTSEYCVLHSAIDSIETNRSFTCPAAGLKMANDLLAANVDESFADRDRIVVLFTDGLPNRLLGEDDGGDTDKNTIYNEIVGWAHRIKSERNAHIFAISTSTLGEGTDRKFLEQVSSDYPDVTAYDEKLNTVTDLEYTSHISTGAALDNVFDDISERTSISEITLDETAVMKEVLSDYVQLDADATVKYKVYTQDYMGNDTWGDLKEFSAMVNTTPATGRVETIEVSGFDYAENYVSEKTRIDPNDSSNTAYRGRKLVLKVYIESRTGFWGGNNVPTNKSTTAIYSNGEIVKPFPEPQVNVPINVTVDAKDKTFYYEGVIDTDGDGKEGDELINKVTIGGEEVTVNNDGTFTPSADWMDDFADAKWRDDSTKPNSDLSNTEPKDYPYTVVVTPNKPGTSNDSQNPSNIAGNVDGGTVRPEDLTESAESATDKGHVYILVPELTFKDSVTDFGTPAEGYDYNTKDYVSTETVWKDMEGGREAGNGIPAVDAGVTAPELTLTYTPDTTGDNSLEEGAFVTDTKVNVGVAIGNKTITDLTTFHWQDCDHAVADVKTHKGDVASNEFWIHVIMNIVPDTVVIDYGLDVVIDVLANDPRLGEIVPSLEGIAAKNGTSFATAAVAGTYGKLSIDTADTSKVRFSLNTSNGMQMKQEEVFGYQAAYTVKGKEVLASSTVTVIPATTIYYEDSFVTYSVFDMAGTKISSDWGTEGKTTNSEQAQDRPGKDVNDALGALDADNIYGYDGAYTNMTSYSMGSAKKFSANNEQFGEAQFTFNGTGFDVISLTGNTTGTITVSVYETSKFINSDGTNNYAAAPVKAFMVDTYYGYKYVLCKVIYEYEANSGEWALVHVEEVSEDTEKKSVNFPTNPKDGDKVEGVEMTWIADAAATDDLYQVPVMKVSGLPYGNYTALITVWYDDSMDHQNKGYYDFYLDAIRIYDPANDGANSNVIKDAYVADGEGWPEYFELRNLLISRNDFNNLVNGTGSGIVFIDNTKDSNNKVTYSVKDYTNFGPNNELYLAPGQSVTFNLDVTHADLDKIHLALKTVGGTAKVKVFDAAKTTNVLAGMLVDETVNTATDLYYDITELNGKNVVITNSGTAGILSITNIKVTYKQAHADSLDNTFCSVSQQSVRQAMVTMMIMDVFGKTEDTLPEDIIPGTTEPEETEPEVTEPEKPTEPEETEPEEPTVPQEPEEPKVFEPQLLQVALSATSVKVGSRVEVTVTTGTDVDSVVINGTKVTRFAGSKDGEKRTWSLWIAADEAGDMAVAVVAYNKDETASAPVVKTISVEGNMAKVFKPAKFKVSLSDTNVKVGALVTVTVTTSKDVEYITVNGSKISKYSGGRYSSTRTWQVRVRADQAGELDIAVVCYDKENTASEPVVQTVLVTAQPMGMLDKVKDLIIGIFKRFR